MAFKKIDLDMTIMSYNLGVIMASSYLYNEKNINLLGDCSDTIIELIGKDNLELDIVKGAIKETIATYLQKNGLDGLADNILSNYEFAN